MLAQLRTLFRYRLLIQSLVSRELKARYRGSVLGFLWSFVNPLLLLLTYGLVFTVMLPVGKSRETEPYFLFLFCGILPWTWFQASIAESAGVLAGRPRTGGLPRVPPRPRGQPACRGGADSGLRRLGTPCSTGSRRQ